MTIRSTITMSMTAMATMLTMEYLLLSMRRRALYKTNTLRGHESVENLLERSTTEHTLTQESLSRVTLPNNQVRSLELTAGEVTPILLSSLGTTSVTRYVGFVLSLIHI